MRSSRNFGPKRVIVHDAHIRENAQKIAAYLAQHNCTMAISTKSLPLEQGLLSIFTEKYPAYDLRADNLAVLTQAGHPTISNLHLRGESHSIMLTDDDDIAYAPTGVQGYYLFFDFGDRREGFVPEDVTRVADALRGRGITSVVLASNIGCLSDVPPTDEYFADFLTLRDAFSARGITVTKFSVGGSNCIPLIHTFASPVPTEIRAGEAILFGTYANVDSDLLALNKENLFLEAWTLRTLGQDEIMFDFGYTHAEQHELLPSACKIVRQSANHSALALPAATAPERILLPLHYRGLTKLSQQRNVAFVRTSQSECNAQSTARSATQLPVQQAAT
ncbi:alanine racemase [Patescibacteria group bacterium]|nr:alanine racemase [Patescibacteria group bacterium]